MPDTKTFDPARVEQLRAAQGRLRNHQAKAAAALNKYREQRELVHSWKSQIVLLEKKADPKAKEKADKEVSEEEKK